MTGSLQIRQYKTPDGKNVYLEWYRKLRDFKAKAAVDRRVYQIENGNFGDHKFIRDGVWELRIDVGPGYRIYYAIAATEVVLLLCGGNKQSQNTDIDRACDYWQNWQKRR